MELQFKCEDILQVKEHGELFVHVQLQMLKINMTEEKVYLVEYVY